jgi:phosphorylase kinase alpha/beta subunit
MINTACIQSLDFLCCTSNNLDKNYWHKLLKGGDNPVMAIPTRLPETEDVRAAQFSDSAPLTPRKRSMSRISQVDLDHQGVLQSPLTSPFYTEEVTSYEVETSRKNILAPLVAEKVLASPKVEATEVRVVKERGTLKADNLSVEVRHVQEKLICDTKQKKYLSLILKDPALVNEAIQFLQRTSNLYDQIDILHYLYSCKGLDHRVGEFGSIRSCLEEVYTKAMYSSQWTIVRQAAGILKKVVNSLTINVTDLLIRQQPVTVGCGPLETCIKSPKSPKILADLIHSSCGCDVREAPLVFEVLTYLGSFVRSNPKVFEGIIRIRIHFFIIAMREEISRMRGCNEEEAVEFLMQVILHNIFNYKQLSPCEMKSLLGQVLTVHEQININADYIGAGQTSIQRIRALQAEFSNSNLEVNQSGISDEYYPLPDQLVLTAQSAGFVAGNFAKIEFTKDGRRQLVLVHIYISYYLDSNYVRSWIECDHPRPV